MTIFLLNPVVGMLRNLSNERWHPILFREAPFPGGDANKGPTRMRSKGHHTDGFASRDEAVAEAKKISDAAGAKLALDKDIGWDGKGVPALNLLCIIDGERVELV